MELRNSSQGSAGILKRTPLNRWLGATGADRNLQTATGRPYCCVYGCWWLNQLLMVALGSRHRLILQRAAAPG